MAGPFAVDYTAGGNAHADFMHGVALNQAGQTVATGASAGATVKFRTKAMNIAGVTYSTVKTGTAS